MEAHFKAFVQSSPQPQIILGTRSPSRRAIVDQLASRYDFKYSVITADIDEQAIRREAPKELVLVLAHAKADAILAKLRKRTLPVTAGYLITCDQV
jgi:septum formation protein